jgi:hypothetical protein
MSWTAAEDDTLVAPAVPARRAVRATVRHRVVLVGPLMKSTDRSLVPDGLPVLSSGGHLVPEDGACLMEYVSVLAGCAFSDHPPCTDPTVAAVARLVNDTSTDPGRQELAILAPELVATGPGDASTTAAVVLATVRAADRATGWTTLPRRHTRRAERRCRRVAGIGPRAALARRLDLLHRLGPGQRRLDVAVSALRGLPASRRDLALRATLTAAIAAATTGSDANNVLRPAGESAAIPRMP